MKKQLKWNASALLILAGLFGATSASGTGAVTLNGSSSTIALNCPSGAAHCVTDQLTGDLQGLNYLTQTQLNFFPNEQSPVGATYVDEVQIVLNNGAVFSGIENGVAIITSETEAQFQAHVDLTRADGCQVMRLTFKGTIFYNDDSSVATYHGTLLPPSC